MKSRLHVYVHTHEHARAHTHTRTLTHNTQHTYCPQLGDEDRRERDRIRKLKAKVCRCVCLAARASLLGAAAGRHTRRPPFLSRASRMFTCECCGSDPHAHMCVHTSCVRSSGEETTQRAAGLTGARLVSPLSSSRNLNGGRSCRRPWRRDAEFQTAKRDISERRRRRRVCGRVSEARAVCAAWRGLINAFVCVQLHKRDTETMSQGA